MTRREGNKETTTMNLSSATATASISARPRPARAALAVACALGAWLALAAGPADAKVIHNPEGSFTGSDRPTIGSFEGYLSGAATDRTGGDVWIAEGLFFGLLGKGDAVDKFNAEGEYAGVQLTGSDTPQGSFAFGSGVFQGIAIDNTASGPNKGDLYVSDIEHSVVDRFSESGTFECQITGRTPSSPEEAEHECNGAAGSLTPDGSIEPSGLAVDPAGDLYVADRAHNVIDVFGPSGGYVKQITSPELGTGNDLASIALDTAGDLYVTNFGSNVIEFDPSGDFVRVLQEGDTPDGVAVDPANNHVYVGSVQENPATHERERAIAEYAPSGELIDTFGWSPLGALADGYVGLAVGPTGEVYATEPTFGAPAKVFIFGGDIILPDVVTQAASDVGEVTATLHGHLDPDAADGGGEITQCKFEYGLTSSYGETASCIPGPNYSGAQDVNAAISGLRPSSTYHFRLEAANADGVPSTGKDETLTTSGPPSFDRASVEALQTSAVFRASVDPWGNDSDCHIQYVSDAVYQQSGWETATVVPCRPEDLGSDFGGVPVKVTVTGLTQATVYHYRFLAANKFGLTETPDRTFETFGIKEFKIEDVKSGQVNEEFDGGQNPRFREWEPGEPSTQAGEHPYAIVTTIAPNKTTIGSESPEGGQGPHGEYTGSIVNPRDLDVELPPGLIGNPTALPQCTRLLVSQENCPPETQVGLIWIRGSGEWEWPARPLYNIVPALNAPAEFGAYIEGQAGAWIPFHVRTGSDYGVSADAVNVIAGVAIEEVKLDVWGVPASPAHDLERVCTATGERSCPDPQPQERPFLTNPTSCTGPQIAALHLDTWQDPGSWLTATTEINGGFTGCNELQFEPSLEAVPTTNMADSPSGLRVDLHVPQDLDGEALEDPTGLATADLKDATVVLPNGLVVNPASASGLVACSQVQIELHGPEPAKCPDASKIGRVEVDTPLVAHPLPGAVYVAAPYDNSFNSLLAIYVAIDDHETGVVVKLAGQIHADPQTGQLTTTFDENPQLPFEDFKLEFFGGPRGVLRTAPVCGTYASQSVLTPWSAPESGPPATWSSAFKITSAPGGATCPAKAAEEPNSPSFSAGTETPTAGSYSPFVLHLSRADDSQELTGINTVLPPGLTAKLAGVTECPDSVIEVARQKTGRQEQESPSCPATSEVGTVNVGAGAGPAPYFTQGRVYLAGPYKGAPFSLAIVTPAVAGPYDLGDVVVRAGLYINPETTQVTVKSDPIPMILDGIPLDVKSIEVKIGRPDFTLNPTSCEKMSVGGETLSVLGQDVVLSNPFQVGGCEALGFKPGFKVSTSGKTSRQDGASLHVLLTYPNAPQGTQANIKSVHVELPMALPSRVSTLNHACVESVFNQNPADCPALSQVGSARAITPVLAVPLEGPAYFVSHGGKKFPELVVVLQGDGITIDLHGETFISPAGITSSTFSAVPDQPITSFELTLPQGSDSALAANGDFCAATKTVLVKRKVTVRVKARKKTVTREVKTTVVAPLIMPTTFTAQNGAVLSQNTKISVSGCSKAAKAKSKKSRHAKKPRHAKTSK